MVMVHVATIPFARMSPLALEAVKPLYVPGNETTPAGEEKEEEKSDLVKQIESRRDLAIIFTCNVCETRSVKTMSRQAYEHGVVIAECPGCKNHHLLAGTSALSDCYFAISMLHACICA